jgi:transglutaminase-like putative cysteine protease
MTDAPQQNREEADLQRYLEPTEYLDSDHELVVQKARELTEGCKTDEEKLERIYYFVRELPYEILESFEYLARGERQASDVIRHHRAFCMGKASSFVALCRAAGIPARIGFQQLHCPEKQFMNPVVRELWGERPLPWHSLGEAYVNGKWLKLDATIPSNVAEEKGSPYTREFDGESHIPTVEGPIIKELGSYPDYPDDIAGWYEDMAREVIRVVKQREQDDDLGDDALWYGPQAENVQRKSVN